MLSFPSFVFLVGIIFFILCYVRYRHVFRRCRMCGSFWASSSPLSEDFELIGGRSFWKHQRCFSCGSEHDYLDL